MIELGARARRRVVVDDDRVISFMGPELRVYSTPAMLLDVEMTCRDLLRTVLAPDTDSVGAAADLRHSAAAVLGAAVEIEAEVCAIDGRNVSFDATVRCGQSVIGTVRHQRAIVETERLKARVRALSAAMNTEA